jgi:hypothetical protein
VETSMMKKINNFSKKYCIQQRRQKIKHKYIYISLQYRERVKEDYSTHINIFIFVTHTHQVKKLFGEGIFSTDDEVWRVQRTVASPLFKKNSLDHMKIV